MANDRQFYRGQPHSLWPAAYRHQGFEAKNGVLIFVSDANRYQAFQQSFAAPDFVYCGQDGRISATNVFYLPIGTIETHGVPNCTTCTRMTVLINLPDVCRGLLYHYNGSGISCSACRGGL